MAACLYLLFLCCSQVCFVAQDKPAVDDLCHCQTFEFPTILKRGAHGVTRIFLQKNAFKQLKLEFSFQIEHQVKPL